MTFNTLFQGKLAINIAYEKPKAKNDKHSL